MVWPEGYRVSSCSWSAVSEEQSVKRLPCIDESHCAQQGAEGNYCDWVGYSGKKI
jgi:hypothetical protein